MSDDDAVLRQLVERSDERDVLAVENQRLRNEGVPEWRYAEMCERVDALTRRLAEAEGLFARVVRANAWKEVPWHDIAMWLALGSPETP